MKMVVNEKKYLIKHTKQLTVGCIVKHLSSGKRYKVEEVKGFKVILNDGGTSYKSKFTTSFEMLKHDYVLLKFIDMNAGYQPYIILNVKELQVSGPKGEQEYGIQYKYLISKLDNKIYRYECQRLEEDSMKPTGYSLIVDVETGEKIELRDEIIVLDHYMVEPVFKAIV